MKRINKKIGLTAALICLFSGNSQLNAATSTGTLSVTATATASCGVGSVGTLAFGNFNPLSTSATTTTATITLTCTNGTSYDVTLAAGKGSLAQRKMWAGGTDSTKTLNYNIYTYTSGACTSSEWGDGVTSSTGKVSGTGTGSAVSLTACGSIPASQTNVYTGATSQAYSDSVTVTVSY